MHRSSVCLALLILAFANSAAAQLAEGSADRLDLRSERQEAVSPARLAKKPPADWTAQIGAAYVDAQDGTRTFGTPFNLKARLGETKLDMRFAGDGYQFVDTDSADKSGLADILFALGYKHPMGVHTLSGEAGFYYPTGGEVGGTSWRQRAALGFVTRLGPLSVGTKGRLVRRSADPGPDRSRYSSTLAGDLGFEIKEDVCEVSMSLARTYRRGAGGTTEGGVSYSHTFGPARYSLGYAQGLTEGAKNKGVELSVRREF